MNYEAGDLHSESPPSASASALPSTLHALDAELKAVFGDTKFVLQYDEEALPSQIGWFIPKQRLGVGGFAVVYLAYDPRLKRDVAVKMPRTCFLNRKELLQRFEREAKAVATLKHLNIQPILEAGQIGGVPYLVSPVCHGSDLAKWFTAHRQKRLSDAGSACSSPCQGEVGWGRILRRIYPLQLPLGKGERTNMTGQLPIGIIVAWMTQLADAVHHAHQRGFIHRDIKPSNILLETDEAYPDEVERIVPKLTDFGLAKALQPESEEALTQSGDMLGTLEYMAPEQASGEQSEVGIATDIHALGIVLYELCTTVSPFRGMSRAETLLKVLNTTPSFASTAGHMPRDLQAICERCLAKKPAQRYATAAELADDLRRFAQGKPTLARPVSRAERLVRWAKSHPWAALTVAAISVMLVVFAVTVLRYEDNLSAAFEKEKGLRKTAEDNAELHSETLYAATLRECTELLAQGRNEAALDKLSRLSMKEGGTDRREFAWRLLHKQLWGQPVTFFRNSNQDIANLRLLQGEEQIASFSKDCIARLWNLKTGEQKTINDKDELFINNIASRHSGPWSFLSSKRQFCIWDYSRSSSSIKRIPVSTPEGSLLGEVNAVHSTDERYGAIAFKDHGVLMIDFLTNTQKVLLREDFQQKRIGLIELMFSPDSHFLWGITTSGHANTPQTRIHCWALPDAKGISEVVPGPWGSHPCYSFSQQGKTLFLGINDGEVSEIELSTLATMRKLPSRLLGRPLLYEAVSERPALPICYQPDSWLYGRDTGEIVKLNLQSGREEMVARHRGPPVGILTSNDGWMLSWDQNDLYKTDLKGVKPRATYAIPAILGTNSGFDFLALGQYRAKDNSMFFGGRDGRIANWQFDVTSPPPDMFHAAFGVWNAAFAPDGRILITAGDDGTIALWDTSLRKRINLLKPHGSMVSGLAVSQDGTLLASASYDNTVQLSNLPSGESVRRLNGHDKQVLCVALSHDARYVAAGAKKGRLILWEVETGQIVFDQAAHTDHIHGLVFSSDGKKLYSCSEDQKIHEWDWKAGTVLRTFTDQDEVWQIARSGNTLYSVGRGRGITRWNLETGQLEKRWFDPQTPLRALCVSPDGRTIVTGGEEGPIRLWLATTGEELTRLETGKHKVLSLAMSQDGNKLAATCHDGQVLLWETPP